MRIPQYLALIPVCAGVFIAADDQTVVVTVLPRIMLDMRVPIGELERASWTITGYLLGYLAGMPLIGRMADIWGHRRIFMLSLLAFMAGSAAVALMPNLNWLVAARVFQAVGAGALVPISIAIVGDLFPPDRRAVPLGIVGASAEAGGVIGPLWGGIIIRYLDWPWVFWINIPLGAVVLLGLVMLLKPGPRHRAKVDYLAGALVTMGLASLTLGLARLDTPDGLMGVYLAASAASLAFFLLRQRVAAEPLLPLPVFRDRTFSAANATHLLVGGALIIGMVTVPLMANTVMRRSPLEGGLLLMRLTAAIPLGAVLGGVACQRLGYRAPSIAGLALAALGYVFMSRWDLATADAAMTVHLIVAGLGFGLLIAPIALAAVNSVEVEYRATAAALITAMRMVGMTLGLASLTAWGSGRFQGLVGGIPLPFPTEVETPEQAAHRVAQFEAQLTDAGLTLFNDFFLVAMGVCLIGMVFAALMAGRRSGQHQPLPKDAERRLP